MTEGRPRAGDTERDREFDTPGLSGFEETQRGRFRCLLCHESGKAKWRDTHAEVLHQSCQKCGKWVIDMGKHERWCNGDIMLDLWYKHAK